MRIPPLELRILLESKPSEIQNLSMEIGRLPPEPRGPGRVSPGRGPLPDPRRALLRVGAEGRIIKSCNCSLLVTIYTIIVNTLSIALTYSVLY